MTSMDLIKTGYTKILEQNLMHLVSIKWEETLMVTTEEDSI